MLGAAASPVLGLGPQPSLLEALGKAPAMLLWSWTNLLLFNLHNQRHPDAVLEDSINKPWRPLPAKRLTSYEARLWMLGMYPVVLASSAALGGMGPCLMEGFSCLWYNEWRGAESPLLKNLLNAAGFACFLAGPLEIVTGSTSLVFAPKALQWLVMIGLAIFLTVHIQDFRDQDGDRLRNRRTVPLVMDGGAARWITALCVMLWSCLMPMFWGLRIGGYLLTASIGGVMSLNLVAKRTVQGDVRSWKMWPFWIMSFFLLPLMRS